MENESHVFGTYVQPENEFVRGEGVYLYDSTGKQFVDFTMGIAANALGHAHPKMIEAVNAQAQNLWHISNLYSTPGREKLARRLCQHSFADKVFFTNSGTESLECAVKTARRYFHNNDQPERTNIITIEGAFHGRTLAMISAGGQEKYLEGFGPRVEGFVGVELDDRDALKAAIDENTAAILLEPIQGEGGIRKNSDDYLKFVRDLCDKHGLALIYDEVQTGIGRTGKFFNYEWSGVEPDIMAIAKGLGSGYPLGACLAREEYAAAMVPGTHGTTVGGNPLAMAVGNAVLDVILEDGFLEHVNVVSGRLRQQLSELIDTFPDLIEEIRGEGLLLGIKCKIPNTDVVTAFREHNLLAPPAGDNVVRLLPPLIVSEEELAIAHTRMRDAFTSLCNQNTASDN